MKKIRYFLRVLTRRKNSPEYTRFQWYMKAITLYTSALGMDLTGVKLAWYDQQVALNRMSAQFAYGPYYLFLCAAHGLCMALGVWKLLEMYWWGKDQIPKLRMENLQEKALLNVKFLFSDVDVTDDLYTVT